MTNVEGSVTNITNELNNGAVGLVKQDAGTKAITVAADTGGKSVSIAGTDGARTLSGVAAGKASTDAVNLGQLIQAGVVDANGNALDILAYDAGSAKSSLTFAGKGGTKLKNVADGTDDSDAINLGQLKKSGLVDAAGNAQDAVVYDANTDRSKITFGNPSGAPVLLSNVAAGMANTDAANVGQLRGVTAAIGGGATFDAQGVIVPPSFVLNDTTYNNVGDALQGLASGIGDTKDRLVVVEKGTSSGPGNVHLATSGDETAAAIAGGAGSVAVGAGSNTSADNGVAIGAGASASGANSVAIGAGSTATRENTVSVGSVGNERAIANVADGVMATDAVNRRQLDSAVDSARAYTDQAIGQVQSDIASARRDSNAAAASSMAVANLPQSIIPGKGMASAAVSNMDGESAVAVGISKVDESGRWVTKLSGTVNTRGKAGVGAGIGFHW